MDETRLLWVCSVASSIFLEAPRIPQGPGRFLPSPEHGGLADLLPCVAIACVVTGRRRLCLVPHNLTPTGRRQDIETYLREVQGGSLCVFSRCCFSLVCVTCRSLFYLKLVSPPCQMIVSRGPVISVLPESVETPVPVLRDRPSAVASLKLSASRYLFCFLPCSAAALQPSWAWPLSQDL